MKKIFLAGLLLLSTSTSIPVLAAEQNTNLTQVDVENNSVISSPDLLSNNYVMDLDSNGTMICSLNHFSEEYLLVKKLGEKVEFELDGYFNSNPKYSNAQVKVIYTDGSIDEFVLTGKNYILTNDRIISKIEVVGEVFEVKGETIDVNAIIKNSNVN